MPHAGLLALLLVAAALGIGGWRLWARSQASKTLRLAEMRGAILPMLQRLSRLREDSSRYEEGSPQDMQYQLASLRHRHLEEAVYAKRPNLRRCEHLHAAFERALSGVYDPSAAETQEIQEALATASRRRAPLRW